MRKKKKLWGKKQKVPHAPCNGTGWLDLRHKCKGCRGRGYTKQKYFA